MRPRKAGLVVLTGLAALASAALLAPIRSIGTQTGAGASVPPWAPGLVLTHSHRASTTLTTEQIQSWHLFGVYGGDTANKTARTQAPKTKLDLTLLGVFRGSIRTSGWAIIRTGNAPERIYAAGDRIAPGVTIEAVGINKVYIQRHGQEETLSLPEWAGASGLEPTNQPGPNRRAPTKKTADNDVDGIKITSTRMGIARKLALRGGDVLLSINGYPMNSLSDVILGMKSMQEASRSTAIIERDGKKIRKNYRN